MSSENESTRILPKFGRCAVSTCITPQGDAADASKSRIIRVSNSGSVPIITTSSLVVSHPALQGYRFLEHVSQHRFGDVWRVSDPSGAVKDLYRLTGLLTEEVLDGLEKMGAAKHLYLLPMAPISIFGDEILLLSDIPDMTLADLFGVYWNRGLQGVPANDLAEILHRVAALLDHFLIEHGWQHFDLNPGNIAFFRNRPVVSGFGVVQFLLLPNRELGHVQDSAYAAPELLLGRITPKCDQYSLALIYAEMRTGVHPVRRRANSRSCGQTVTRWDLGLLSQSEREVLQKSLHPQAYARFELCEDLMLELKGALGIKTNLTDHYEFRPPSSARGTHHNPTGILEPSQFILIETAEDEFIDHIQSQTRAGYVERRADDFRYFLNPQKNIEHTCFLRFPLQQQTLPLAHFREQWSAQTLLHDKRMVRYRIPINLSWWVPTRRMIPLRVEIAVDGDAIAKLSIFPVRMTIGWEKSEHNRFDLEKAAIRILRSLRDSLSLVPDIRAHERWECHRPLHVLPFYNDLQSVQAVECQGLNISSSGIGFLAPGWLPASHIFVNLPWLSSYRDVAVRASIVRNSEKDDGWFEMGAKFEK